MQIVEKMADVLYSYYMTDCYLADKAKVMAFGALAGSALPSC